MINIKNKLIASFTQDKNSYLIDYRAPLKTLDTHNIIDLFLDKANFYRTNWLIQ